MRSIPTYCSALDKIIIYTVRVYMYRKVTVVVTHVIEKQDWLIVRAGERAFHFIFLHFHLLLYF